MELRQFLEKRAKEEDAEGERTSKIRGEWISAVSRLIEQIEDWLHEADPGKILTIERESHRIREAKIGTYDVPGLMVRLGAREVRIVPVARYSIGSMIGDNLGRTLRYGRVDITDGARKTMLYRPGEGDQWIVVNGQSYQGEDLSQATFEAAILKLLQ